MKKVSIMTIAASLITFPSGAGAQQAVWPEVMVRAPAPGDAYCIGLRLDTEKYTFEPTWAIECGEAAQPPVEQE